MAFFEQIGRRITDAGQGVAQQTKNLTDMTRLNAKISENKKKMSQLLFEMGEDYYKRHRKDMNCEEQEYIERVNELFTEIIRCQDEIEAIKKADVCKVCGSRIEEGSSFCTSCGARLSGDELEDSAFWDASPSMKCPVCGAEIDEDSSFCTSCGKKLSKFDEKYDYAEDDAVQEDIQYSARICPVCGSEAEDEDLFCLNCGTKL